MSRVELSIIFDHYKGGFRARFVRIRQQVLKSHVDQYKDLKYEVAAEEIKDLPHILQSTKNQLLLKLVGGGYTYPVWGVEVTDEAEKQWYMENLVGISEVKAPKTNVKTMWTDEVFYT